MANQETEFAKDGRRRAAQLMKRILIGARGQLDEQLRPQGTTSAQLALLRAIQQSPKSSGAQLARSCHITPQTIQTLIKRAEESGWIVRGKDRVNDRILTASLTLSGEKLLKAADKAVKIVEAKLWQGIPDSSIATLNDLLTQCLKNIEPE